MPALPKSIAISSKGLVIDGKSFPWHIAETATITISSAGLRSLMVEILAPEGDTEVTL